jgi:hypothetical protein
MFQIIHLPLIYSEFCSNFRSIVVVGVIPSKHLCNKRIFPAHGCDKLFVNHLTFRLIHRRKVIVIIHKFFRYFIIDNSRLAVFWLSTKRTVRTLVAFWAYDERFLLTGNSKAVIYREEAEKIRNAYSLNLSGCDMMRQHARQS